MYTGPSTGTMRASGVSTSADDITGPLWPWLWLWHEEAPSDVDIGSDIDDAIGLAKGDANPVLALPDGIGERSSRESLASDPFPALAATPSLPSTLLACPYTLA